MITANPSRRPGGPAQAVQRPLISVERTRALVSLDTVVSELVDYNEDEVLALIFDHWCLGPAWNIASKDATKRELRVLMAGVRHFKALGEKSDSKFTITEDRAHALIFPGGRLQRPFFSGLELQQAFNCKSSHIINLLEEGSLKKMPGTTWHPGRGGSPVIARDVAIKFLKDRREI